jgi:hypothetical protein
MKLENQWNFAPIILTVLFRREPIEGRAVVGSEVALAEVIEVAVTFNIDYFRFPSFYKTLF